MLSLHKKRRTVFSAVLATAIILPALIFAANKISTANNTFALTYSIPDDYTTFTDPNFYDCVVETFVRDYMNFDIDSLEEIQANGLNDEQLSRIDILTCRYRDIANATGLEKMYRMSQLNLQGNQLTSLDASGFNSMISLLVLNNQLESINLSGDTALRTLDLQNNQLTTIDLSTNTNLRTLDLSSNNFSEIDLSHNTTLINFYAHSNRLTSIDLSNNTSLRNIRLGSNRIKLIDISNNAQLENLLLDDIIIYTSANHPGKNPSVVDGNYIYDLHDLAFMMDGSHDGYGVTFSIEDTDYYSYDKANMILTVNDPDNAGRYIQINGDDGRDRSDAEDSSLNLGGFDYKFGLPYIIDFDTNNGTGTFETMYCYPETSAGNCTITLPTTEPARTGYDFLGWATSASATSAAYQAGDDIAINASQTLYAVWGLEPHYITLSFDLKGGTGEVPMQTCATDIDHSTCDVTIPDVIPEKAGLYFLGWATSQYATSAEYQPGDTFTLSDPDNLQILNAIWAPIYNLNYSANDGEGAPESQSCHPTTTDGSCAVNISNIAPTRYGYRFLGWAESPTASEAFYHSGDAVSLSANKNIYAIWELITTDVTLSFNLNGGSGAVTAQTCATDAFHPTCDVTIPNIEPTKEGYTFLGWAESSTATTAAYDKNDPVALSGNKTLYAVWELTITTISLNFDLNGGDEGAPTTQTCTIDVNHPTCIISIPGGTTPLKNNYAFIGWATSSSAISGTYLPYHEIELSEDTTLYAIWVPIYTLYYNGNGGSENPGAAGTCHANSTIGDCIATVVEFPDLTREGYRFLGWAEDSTATTADYHAGGSIILTSDTTLYAVWELITTDIHLYFDLNGADGTVAAQICTTDAFHPTCDVTIPNTEPTKEGYTFLGWADSADATEVVYEAGDTITLDADRTIYAVWEEKAEPEPEPEPEPEEPEEPDLPVPDTSAPDTGANFMSEGGSIVIALTATPAAIAILAAILRKYLVRR